MTITETSAASAVLHPARERGQRARLMSWRHPPEEKSEPESEPSVVRCRTFCLVVVSFPVTGVFFREAGRLCANRFAELPLPALHGAAAKALLVPGSVERKVCVRGYRLRSSLNPTLWPVMRARWVCAPARTPVGSECVLACVRLVGRRPLVLCI